MNLNQGVSVFLIVLALLLSSGIGAFFGIRSLYRNAPTLLMSHDMDAMALIQPLAPVSIRSELGDFEIPVKLPEVARIAVPVRKGIGRSCKRRVSGAREHDGSCAH